LLKKLLAKLFLEIEAAIIGSLRGDLTLFEGGLVELELVSLVPLL
jgi:hypothetical protein